VRKATNEDRVLIGCAIVADDCVAFDAPSEGFICVSDGVGGNAGSAKASQFLVEALANNPSIAELNTADDVRAQLLGINDLLIDYAIDVGLPTMAATLTGLLFTKDTCYLHHVGNTRAFALQGGYLKQLTEDHTTKRFLQVMHRDEEAEAANPSEIIACFGGGKANLIDRITVREISLSGTILLTSDGIHDFVSLTSLEGVMSSDATGVEKCEMVIDKALAVQSTDDLSVVIIDLMKGS
jgi:protein phosphatase